MLGGFSRLWIYISLGCLELRRDALEGGEEEPSVLVVGTPLCGQLLAEVRDLILQTLDQRSSPLTLYIMSRLSLVFIQIDVDAVVFPLMVELSALYALSHRLYADAEGLRRLAGCHASSGQCRVSCTASVTYCPVKVTAPCYTSREARAAQKTRPSRVRCLLGAVLPPEASDPRLERPPRNGLPSALSTNDGGSRACASRRNLPRCASSSELS